MMKLEKAKKIDNWSTICKSARNSTISYFNGGVSNNESTEILVWENKDNVGLESTNKKPPEWANFIIEVKKNGKLVKEKFAETEVGAWNKVNRTARHIDEVNNWFNAN